MGPAGRPLPAGRRGALGRGARRLHCRRASHLGLLRRGAGGARDRAGAHWYLGVLATDPARQGTGLGRAVTTPMLAAADRAGLPAYLETASDPNVAIYRRLGFEVAREVDLPDGGPRCWLMRRDPQEVA